MMSGDVSEYTAKSSELYWAMIGDNLVVLAAFLRRESHVRSALACNSVAKSVQCASQVRAGEIAGDFHGISTSSRTKCRRISRGAAAGSSK
jgi:hypothetical protein